MTTRQIPYDLILARTLKGGIGKNNNLPWKLPLDLKMFKKITTSCPQGNAIIMGRKTFESFQCKPLPNRLNIIISKSQKLSQNDSVKEVGDLKEALALSREVQPEGRAFVIGGSKVFEEALPDCRYVYETLVADEVECDVFAPRYDDQLECSFVSKTFRQNNLRFDFRQYYNPKNYSRPCENQFGVAEH